MTAPAPLGLTPEMPDAICPCCRLTVLNPFTVATWRGQECCVFCADELADVDAESARRQIARNRLYFQLREP